MTKDLERLKRSSDQMMQQASELLTKIAAEMPATVPEDVYSEEEARVLSKVYRVHKEMLGNEARVQKLLRLREQGLQIPDFNIRGPDYRTALRHYRSIRNQEVSLMVRWSKLQCDERMFEVACGDGFWTWYLNTNTVGSEIIALDQSDDQIAALNRNIKSRFLFQEHSSQNIFPIIGEPDDPRIIDKIDQDRSIVGRLGPVAGTVKKGSGLVGTHHVRKHQQMFSNFYEILSPGGVVVLGDVPKDSFAAAHLDGPVNRHCLTGHKGNYFSEDEVREMSKNAGLRVNRIRVVDLLWVANSPWELAMFVKGLHAYRFTDQELADYTRGLTAADIGQLEPRERLTRELVVILDELRFGPGWEYTKRSGSVGECRMRWQLMMVELEKPNIAQVTVPSSYQNLAA